jgi:uncharacterized protein YjdB
MAILRNKWFLCPILLLIALSPAASFGQSKNLTVVVLVDSTNGLGYNTSSSTPGEYQRFAERYLENLQIPYQVFDVSSTPPPSDINSRQLIVAAHSGLNLPASWQNAIVAAVNGGTGFVNLDFSSNIGNEAHIQTIFGSTGSNLGTASTSITIPATYLPGGSTPHYIMALQHTFPATSGNLVYNFHDDGNGVTNTATSTVLAGAHVTVLAKLGNDPLVAVTNYGSGRAVSFGSLDYLNGDRFGFLMGMDDVFWRSLVWAARKPFVVRGYPRLWAVQQDDTQPDWGFRVGDMYNTTLTGNANPDGTGGPWKVTGYLFYSNLVPGGNERISVINNINANNLKVVPHTFDNTNYGTTYWNGSAGALTDAQWLTSLQTIATWKTGNGGSDTIPSFSRSLVAHFWDLSNNTGYDLWNTLGIRYITEIQKPGFQYTDVDLNQYNGAERLNAHPFWVYNTNRQPKLDANENYPFFFADDYSVGSRAGLPTQKFYLFITQHHDPTNLNLTRADFTWPSDANHNNITVAQSLNQLQTYTWRFWSSLCPAQLYTHDHSNYEWSTVTDRQSVISQGSSWLNTNSVRHLFMESMGDYIYARNKSLLSQANFDGSSQLSLTFTGKATDPDGRLISTQFLVFSGDNEGVWESAPGFGSGLSLTTQYPPSPNPLPATTSISPSSAPAGGAAFSLTVNGTGFVSNSIVRWNGSDRSTIFVSSTQLTAAITAGDIAAVGTATVTVFNPPSGGGSSGPQTITIFSTSPPVASRFSPTSGPSAGGNVIQVFGANFGPSTKVFVGGIAATNVSLLSPGWVSAVLPPGTIGTTASVQVTTTYGSSTAPTTYAYLDPTKILMEDSFNGDSGITWNVSPLGLANGWTMTQGAFDYTGIGASQRYAGSATWANYDFEAKILLYSMNNWPGGIRGRVNPTTGQCYTLWLYPGSGQIVLYRVTGWSIDSSGLTNIGSASMTFDTINYHTVRLSFIGSSIQVFWDGVLKISATDTAYAGGEVALDVSNQHVRFEDVLVTTNVPPGPPLTGLSVSPASFALLGAGTTQQLTVTASFGDGSTQNVTSSAGTGYTSSNTGAATVNATGLVTAVNTGNAVITASYGGQNATATVSSSLLAPPNVTRVSPTLGSTAGGDRMDLIGSFLATNVSVTIGGKAATVLSAQPDGSRMTVTVPAGSLGSANIVLTNSAGTTTLTGAYTYADPLTILFADNFNLGSLGNWTASPLGLFTNWSASQDVADYNGGGATQIYAGNPQWGNYNAETKFQVFNGNNYPGGLRGRVNTSTGAAYVAWIYPGNNQVKLLRTAAWSIDAPGLVVLQTANVNITPNVFHLLRLVFSGTQISVLFDGATVIQTTDSTLAAGAVALDVSSQHIQFDDVLVTANDPSLVLTTSVTVSPTNFNLWAGGTQQLTVTASYSNGSTQNVSTDPRSTYVSSNTAVATVNSTGLVTPAGNGTATITATYGGYSASAIAQVNVLAPVVTRISPPQGTTAGGNRMDLVGSNLSTGVTVKIGTNTATLLSAQPDGSRMTVTVPAGSAGNAAVMVSNASGSTTVSGGYTYVDPLTILFADDFNLGSLSNWTASPLGLFGNWSATADAADYNGGGHTQIYAGNPGWTNYSVEANFQLFSSNNYPGGLRGRVNSSTGVSYAAWLYPGSNQIKLLRTAGWNVDTSGLQVLQTATVSSMNPNVFHHLQMIFVGSQITVVYDGVTVIQLTDTTLASGAIALDVSNQHIQFDDVFVTQR